MGLTGGRLLRQDDIRWVLRGSLQQPACRDRGPVDGAARVQPVRALRDVETADGDQKGGHDRSCIHPAPGIEIRHDDQHPIADRGAPKAPTAWKANAPSTNLPRLVLGMFSEMIMCAVG